MLSGAQLGVERAGLCGDSVRVAWRFLCKGSQRAIRGFAVCKGSIYVRFRVHLGSCENIKTEQTIATNGYQ